MSTFSVFRKHWKFPAIALCALGFALVSVLSQSEAEEHKPLVTPPQAGYASAVAGIGVVEPKSELIALGTELAGVVRHVHVKVGDVVEKGAPLFTLDQRDVEAQIAVLQAALATAEVQLADASAQFALVSNLKDKRAVAKDDFNRRKFGKQQAAARVKEIQAQLKQATTTKERMEVKAPINATVLEVNLRPGEFAAAGSTATPLMLLGDMSAVHVRVEVDEENAPRIRKESPAKAYARGDTQTAYPLTFVRFEPYVRPKQNLAAAGQRVDTRVLRVIYALPENSEHLFVGQQMDVYIEEQE